jgi:hypothetical protein
MPRFFCLLATLLPLLAFAADESYDAMFSFHVPPAAETEGEEGTPFNEAIADCDTLQGFFTIYSLEKTGEAWFEVMPEQLGDDILLSATWESGAGANHIIEGLPAVHHLIRFEKQGEKMRVLRPNLKFRAADAQNVRQVGMVAGSTADHPFALLEIKALPHPDRKSFLLSLDDFLKCDILGHANDLSNFLKAEYSLQADHSYYTMLKSFETNTEVGVMQSFASSKRKRGWSHLEDPAHVQLSVRYSLSALPESDFTPRLADARVGYFQTLWRVWGDESLMDPYMRVANHWNLQKAHPESALSEPLEPIVYWMDKRIPEQWRPAVRRGFELWNQAFEEAGFENALVLKQMPDDATWDPADIRYNTIRWVASNEPAFGAMGPSQVNPYTGEILNADILVEADMVRRVAWGWRASIETLGHVDASTATQCGSLQDREDACALEVSTGREHSRCDLSSALLLDAQNMGLQLYAAGAIRMNDPLPVKQIEGYIVALIAHEVGHTLGLRHNFAGSRMLSFEQLWDQELTSRKGLISSVMEYDPVCVALDAAKQGDYYTTTLGPYDRFAIRWAYTPSGEGELQKDAEFAKHLADASIHNPDLRYGTDGDAHDVRGWGSAVDPSIRTFDLSSDEAAFTKHQLEVAKKNLRLPPADFLSEGEDQGLYRRFFERAFGGYWRAIEALPRYLGAYKLSRQPFAAGEEALVPWDPEEQRELMHLLLEALTDEQAWQIPADYLSKMSPIYKHTFDGSLRQSTVDLPLQERLNRKRTWILQDLYCPRRLARMAELETRTDQGALYSLDEHFEFLRHSIWNQSASTSSARGLQKAHLDILLEMHLDASLKHLPFEARLLAAADLRWLRASLKGKLSVKGLGRIERAFLRDCSERVALALDRERDKL